MILSNMTDLDVEDSLTILNTQLNKSMVLMDTTTEGEMHQPKNNKSIRINTKIQPPNQSKSPSTARKSILKKPGRTNGTETEQSIESSQDVLNNSDHNKLPTNTATLRPRNINDLIQEEDLVIESTDSTFTLDDISDSEDIWIMDIPRTIDPRELKNQTLVLGDKSKFKVREERYCTVNNNVKLSTTCVFSTNKVKSRFKTVNIKPAGAITVRRKLSGVPKIKPMQIENCSVPFPKNLKARHPLFGVNFEGKVKKDAVK
ncbi:uncharacterized protein LOC100881978 [Megachile rotundata]|uniref:uncharacterized protein LOC100881978 n=1 Tax=Megachile rotundata TaxID=143995 RepID=UPI000258EE4D|nr:PREDICTED: uncharacterized protein LOC100881978 [Megachile rotundata]